MALFGSHAQRLGMRPGLLNFAEEEEKKRAPGFWAGGDKFTTRDGIAGLLAVVGDAFSRQAGGDGGATDMLGGQRLSAIEMARKQQQEAEQRQALMEAAQRQGVSPDEVILQQGGIKRPTRKGLQPVSGPTGVFVWDRDNERFANPAGGIPGGGQLPQGFDPNRYEILPDDEGGAGGNARGGFPRRYRR